MNRLFQAWNDAKQDLTVEFDYSLDYLDVCSGSEG